MELSRRRRLAELVGPWYAPSYATGIRRVTILIPGIYAASVIAMATSSADVTGTAPGRRSSAIRSPIFR